MFYRPAEQDYEKACEQPPKLETVDVGHMLCSVDLAHGRLSAYV